MPGEARLGRQIRHALNFNAPASSHAVGAHCLLTDFIAKSSCSLCRGQRRLTSRSEGGREALNRMLTLARFYSHRIDLSLTLAGG